MDGRRNWDWHNMIDITPFLRYESTGDSDQINCDLNMDHAEVKTYEVDDALSCCSDSYDNTTFNKHYGDDHDEGRAQRSNKESKKKDKCYAAFLNNKSKEKEQDSGYNPNYCKDCNDDDDEGDHGSINQVSTSCGNIGYGASSKHKKKKKIIKSNAFDGSSVEPKEENDKFFWDTCLDN